MKEQQRAVLSGCIGKKYYYYDILMGEILPEWYISSYLLN
jgi:hypothetical protein